MSYLLIIDDDQDFAETIALVLRAEGLEVDIALDPMDGLAAIEERVPDLLILDVMFPENISAGFEIARKLHLSAEYRSIPILMLSAVNEKYPFGFSAADIDSEWLPVRDFLEKPVALDVLKDKVHGMLAAEAD